MRASGQRYRAIQGASRECLQSRACRRGGIRCRRARRCARASAATRRTTGYAHFAKENIRSKCNQHKVKGTLVNYKAAEKYTGNDEFDLLILYPGGFAREHHFNISVR